MNVPYVKKHDGNGNVISLITFDNPYITLNPNRQERRKSLQKERFRGEGKNYPLTVLSNAKFIRAIQEIEIKPYINQFNKGKYKRIEHYIPC